jgi:general secretion pathway protein A
MYESFFELREKPFSLLPDPGFLFMSRQHQQALTLLEYGLLNQAGFIILTGEIGSGKTTLMRHLLGRLDASFSVGLISHTHQSLGELMDWVCMAFDLKAKKGTKLDKYQIFIDFLIETYGKGQRVLLIVDEAQNLGVEKLEELRLLSNINAGKDLVLQLMLLGQPQLRDLLRAPNLEQFAQRVTASYHIGPLDAAETKSYIRHRIAIAGGTREIFTEDACLAVHHYSKGLPRLINLICDTALVYAYGADQRVLDGAAIDEFVASHTPNLMISVDLERDGRAPLPDPETHSDLTDSGRPAWPWDGHRDTSPAANRTSPLSKPGFHAPPYGLDVSASDDAAQSPIIGQSPSRSSHAPAPPQAEPSSGFPDRFVDDQPRPRFALDSPASKAAPLAERQGQTSSENHLRTPADISPAGTRHTTATPRWPSHKTEPQLGPELRVTPDSAPSAFPESPHFMDDLPEPAPKRKRRNFFEALMPIASGVLIIAAVGIGVLWLAESRNKEEPPTGLLAMLAPLLDRIEMRGDIIPLPIRPSEESPADVALPDADVIAEQRMPDAQSSEAPVENPPTSGARAPVDAAADPNLRSGSDTTAVSTSETDSPSTTESAGVDTAATAPAPTSGNVFGMLRGSPMPDAADRNRQTSSGADTDEPDSNLSDRSDSSTDPITDVQQELKNLSYAIQRERPDRLTADLGPLLQFDDGSIDLQPNGKALLARIADILRDHDDLRIRVIAHTDSSGTASLNRALSAQRAQTVASYLESLDIPSERLESEGRGKDELRVDRADENLLGPWINRRIEIQLLSTTTPAGRE